MNGHQEPRDQHGLTKVVIPLAASDWHSYSAESVWAAPVGAGLVRIANVPFYADGLSYADIAGVRDDAGQQVITGVVRRGGHSTYRICLAEDRLSSGWRSYWLPLEALGCTYERATNRLFAIDVPPATDIHAAYDLLDAGEQAGVWSFQEGHCGHPH
jgi:hypothetical protein